MTERSCSKSQRTVLLVPGATVRYIDAIGTRRLKIQTCLKTRNRNDSRRAQSAYKSDGI